MSTNLVSTIMQSLSAEAIGKIAATLGINPAVAQKGITAGIPGILAALANTASTTEGAQRLGNSVSRIEDMPGHDIVRNLLGPNQNSLAESGSNMLTSLLGGSSLNTLSGAIAQFAGAGQGTSKRLLGLLAPLVMGFLRREQVAGGLDARGLSSLLSSQRENIERAMPSGLGRSLQSPDTPDLRRTAAPERAGRPAAARESKSSSRGLAYWLLPAVVAAAAIAYLIPPREEKQTVQEPAREQTATANNNDQPQPQHDGTVSPMPANATALGTAGAALENEIVANISRLRASLQNIKDSGSAQASVGELKDITAQFGRLKAKAQQLSPEARRALAADVSARVPDLNGLIDRIGSQTNLSGEAKPAIDNLKVELLNISKA